MQKPVASAFLVLFLICSVCEEVVGIPADSLSLHIHQTPFSHNAFPCLPGERIMRRATICSPDSTMFATIISYKFKPGAATESTIKIFSAKGVMLCSKSFVSRDHQHGMEILHAQWTVDSKYLVFNGVFDGGHQPSHLPTYFYSTQGNQFTLLDPFVGIWVTGNFHLTHGDSVTVMVRGRLPSGEFTDSLSETVNLRDLLKSR